MTESALSQAWKLYRQGRFAAGLALLEPKVFQFRDDPEFFRIMGLCCLRLGDWKGGETYLQRSRQLDDAVHRDTLLGLLAVATRQRDYPEALKVVVQLLDRDADDKVAKKAMAELKAAASGPEGTPGPSRETILTWLPSFHKANPVLRAWVFRGALVTGGIATIGLGVWLGLSLVRPPEPTTPPRPGPEHLTDAADTSLSAGNPATLNLSSEEIQKAWNAARKAFQEYHDSEARYQINRLLLSNASDATKARAQSLIGYLHEPDFSRPEATASYQDVKASPRLYEGCAVQWKGVIGRLVSGDTKITFDLLLGYGQGQVVEGVVPVELNFAALLKNSQVVEVLGRVALREGQWYVQGTSLRDLGYRAP